MTYDNELTLISRTFTADEFGQQMPTIKRTTVLCNKKSATRQEKTAAATTDLFGALVFTIHLVEYERQTEVEFEGVAYEVYDTYELGIEEIELKCRATIGGKANV